MRENNPRERDEFKRKRKCGSGASHLRLLARALSSFEINGSEAVVIRTDKPKGRHLLVASSKYHALNVLVFSSSGEVVTPLEHKDALTFMSEDSRAAGSLDNVVSKKRDSTFSLEWLCQRHAFRTKASKTLPLFSVARVPFSRRLASMSQAFWVYERGGKIHPAFSDTFRNGNRGRHQIPTNF